MEFQNYFENRSPLCLIVKYERNSGVMDDYNATELKFERLQLPTVVMDEVAGTVGLGIRVQAVCDEIFKQRRQVGTWIYVSRVWYLAQ